MVGSGFCGAEARLYSAKLVLADGQRVWEQTNGCPPTRSVVQELQGGRLGRLELKASLSETSRGDVEGAQWGHKSSRPSVADERLFEIVSELVAEGWIEAASKLQNGDRAPLRFETRGSQPRNHSFRRFVPRASSTARPGRGRLPYRGVSLTCAPELASDG